MNLLKFFMPQKTYRIYHENGKPENVEGSSAQIIRDTKGKMVAVKIGKRKIENPIQCWELMEKIEQPARKPINDDDED